MQSCCCAKVRPAPSPFRRYRRSTVTRAPRKRTFIANMNKFLIDYQLPSGLSGESFFGASTLCQVPSCRPVDGAEHGQLAAPAPAYETASGNGNGRGRGRPGAALSGDDDQDGDFQVSDQISALPFIVAVAFCPALYPALELLAPPAAAAVVLQPQPMAAEEQKQEHMTLETIQHAIDAFLMDAGSDSNATAQASEPKLAAHM